EIPVAFHQRANGWPLHRHDLSRRLPGHEWRRHKPAVYRLPCLHRRRILMSLVQPIRLRVLPKIIPADGKNVELQTTATEIQWRVEGDTTWQTLVPLSEITGPQGPDGVPGADGGGVPNGGATGQVLAKSSDDDQDVQWTAAGSGDMLKANSLSDVASVPTA